MFVVTFAVGAAVGYASGTQGNGLPDCETLETSEELASAAWEALEARDDSRVLDCSGVLIARHHDEAVGQQKELEAVGKFAQGDRIPTYWALNDVGTAWFIRGELYRRLGEKEKAREAYEAVVRDFSFAQCWDPRGFYWQVAKGSKEKLRLLDQ